MSDPRLSAGYEPRWDADSNLGRLGEVAADKAAASSREVKTDQKAWMTGNLFIEFECRGKPSGLMLTEAAYWWFVIGGDGSEPGEVAIVVPVELLKDMVRGCRIADQTRGSHPTRGYLLPLERVLGRRPEVRVESPPATRHTQGRRPTARGPRYKPDDAIERWKAARGIG